MKANLCGRPDGLRRAASMKANLCGRPDGLRRAASIRVKPLPILIEHNDSVRDDVIEIQRVVVASLADNSDLRF